MELTKNPITVASFYPYSEETMAQFKADRRFNQILKDYIFAKMQYERGLYGSAVSQFNLAGYLITCKLLYNDLLVLDSKRCLTEVPKIKLRRR